MKKLLLISCWLFVPSIVAADSPIYPHEPITNAIKIMSNKMVVATNPHKGDFDLPNGEKYSNQTSLTDGIMTLVIYYNRLQEPTISPSPFYNSRFFFRNDMTQLAMKDVTVVVNLSQEGSGAIYFGDNLKNPDRPNGDTRTFNLGKVQPQEERSSRFSYQIEKESGRGSEYSFIEVLFLVPIYTVDYLDKPLQAPVEIDANISE